MKVFRLRCGECRAPLPPRIPPELREEMKDVNPSKVMMTIRCDRCKQVIVVTAKDYVEAA